jgi:hypothetical protein
MCACVCVCIHIYLSFFIHWWTFRIILYRGLVNPATVNMGVQTSFQHTELKSFFHSSRINGCEMYLIVLLTLYFPNDWWFGALFQVALLQMMLIGHLYIFFGKIAIEVPCPLFNVFFLFLLLSCVILYLFCIVVPYQIHDFLLLDSLPFFTLLVVSFNLQKF